MLEDLNLDNTEDKDHPDELTEYPIGYPFYLWASAAEETRRRVCQVRSAKSLRTQAKTLWGSVFNESVAETNDCAHAAASEAGVIHFTPARQIKGMS